MTRASSELDDLLQCLAGERLWTVPVRAVREGAEEDFMGLLAPQWRRWRAMSGGGAKVTVRFMDVVLQGNLQEVWRRVEAVRQLGGIEERSQSTITENVGSTKKRRTLLQQLPEDVLTAHIVPELFKL